MNKSPSSHSAVPRGLTTTVLASAGITIMAGATISAALPGIQRDLGTSPQADLLVKMMLTLPAVAIAFGSTGAGWLADRFGRRRVLLWSLVLYALGGVSGALTADLWLMAAGRLVLGLGVAGLMTAGTAILADYYSGEARGRILGLQGALMGFGGVLLLFGGGLLAEIHWRAPFYLYLAALAILPPALWFVRDRPRSPRAEAQVNAPEVASGSFMPIYLLALLSMIGFFVSPIQLPFFIESRFGMGPAEAGAAVALGTLVGSATSLAYGPLGRRLSHKAVYCLSLLLLGLGYLIIGLAALPFQVFLGAAFTGLGSGLAMPNFNVWVSELAPEAIRGRALGGLTTAVHIGQFLSPLLVAILAATLGPEAVFTATGAIFAIANLLGLAWVLLNRTARVSKRA
jgi:MFS family permease